MAARAWDLLDRRILAAIAFVDTVGAPVTCPVAIAAPAGFGWFLKKPGMVIVTRAGGLDAHSAGFDTAPGTPTVRSKKYQLELRPSNPAYAARSVELRLPRHPDPANVNSVFRAIEIVLSPTPLARPAGLNAALRVSVTRSDDGRAIEGALVRLRPDSRPETFALTDAAGEALLFADAIPFASSAPGPSMTRDWAAEIDAVVDPATARFHAPDAVFAARENPGALIDPDALAASGTASGATSLAIAAGLIRTAALSWTPP
jgi:hypothetical protein